MEFNANINQLKRQLNIEETYDDDNVLLQHYLDVAEQSVQLYCGVTGLTMYTGETMNMPISITQAVIMLAAHFYLSRNIISYGQGYEIPFTLKWLLDPYRDFIVG